MSVRSEKMMSLAGYGFSANFKSELEGPLSFEKVLKS